MTWLRSAWPRIRQGLVVAGWVILGAVLLVLALLGVRAIGRRRGSVGTPPSAIADAADEIGERVMAANARAAVEVTAARTKDEAVRLALKTILRDEDAQRQRHNLIALRERVARESQ